MREGTYQPFMTSRRCPGNCGGQAQIACNGATWSTSHTPLRASGSAGPEKAAHLLHDLHPWKSLAFKVALRSRGITREQTKGLWPRVIARFVQRPRHT